MRFPHLACASLVAASLAVGAVPAAAEPAVGIAKAGGNLVTFDTGKPGVLTSSIPITGLGTGERLADIDFRHHPSGELNPLPPPQLFGIGVIDALPEDVARLYTIEIATGAATPVGAPFAVTDGGRYGIDFSPTADRIRGVNDKNENFRINPNNGTRSDLPFGDTDLSPAPSEISSVAYDHAETSIPPVPATGATAWAINLANDTLVTIGGLGSNPTPNGGEILNARPLMLAHAPGSGAGFDISPSGTAFATLVDATTGLPGLYTIDLGTGSAGLVGALPDELDSVAILPGGAPDATAPSIALAGVKRKISLKALLKGVTVKVTPSEPASLNCELLAAARKGKGTGKRSLASFTRVLATKSLSLAEGQQTLKLKPRKRQVGSPRKRFKVRLQVAATDAAGNAAAVTRTIAVKPPRAAGSRGRR